MDSAVISNKWTEQEDILLAQWQAVLGNRWAQVADHIPHKTGQQCAQRWRHRVNPSITHGRRWTEAEDVRLVQMVGQHGHSWAEIARSFPGRTDQQCMGRWRRQLDPSIKRDNWEPDEDAVLISMQQHMGPAWSAIADALPGRTPAQCRTRWHYMSSGGVQLSSGDESLEEYEAELHQAAQQHREHREQLAAAAAAAAALLPVKRRPGRPTKAQQAAVAAAAAAAAALAAAGAAPVNTPAARPVVVVAVRPGGAGRLAGAKKRRRLADSSEEEDSEGEEAAAEGPRPSKKARWATDPAAGAAYPPAFPAHVSSVAAAGGLPAAPTAMHAYYAAAAAAATANQGPIFKDDVEEEDEEGATTLEDEEDDDDNYSPRSRRRRQRVTSRGASKSRRAPKKKPVVTSAAAAGNATRPKPVTKTAKAAKATATAAAAAAAAAARPARAVPAEQPSLEFGTGLQAFGVPHQAQQRILGVPAMTAIDGMLAASPPQPQALQPNLNLPQQQLVEAVHPAVPALQAHADLPFSPSRSSRKRAHARLSVCASSAPAAAAAAAAAAVQPPAHTHTQAPKAAAAAVAEEAPSLPPAELTATAAPALEAPLPPVFSTSPLSTTPFSTSSFSTTPKAPPRPSTDSMARASPALLDLLHSPLRPPGSCGEDPFTSPNFNGLVTPEWARVGASASAAARTAATEARRQSGSSSVARRLDVDSSGALPTNSRSAEGPGNITAEGLGHCQAAGAAGGGASQQDGPTPKRARLESPQPSLGVNMATSGAALHNPAAGGIIPWAHTAGALHLDGAAGLGGCMQGQAAIVPGTLPSGATGLPCSGAAEAFADVATARGMTLTGSLKGRGDAAVLQHQHPQEDQPPGAAMVAAAAAEVEDKVQGGSLSSSAVRMKLHALLGNL